MKSVLISIRPKWCELIASGKKTLEIRKTRPKLETPFKCYICCTKPSTKNPNEVLEIHRSDGKITRANGKAIGEFVCDEIEYFVADYRMNTEQTEHIADLACVEMSELIEYGYYSDCLFAWHISELKIYDKPRDLSEFTRIQATRFGMRPDKAKHPPKSWCYVESLQEVEE